LLQVLLLSCVLRLVFWLGMCNLDALAVGMACLWWSNSMVLLCTAAVIFQWSSAVTAGRVTAEELQRSRRITAMHALVFLHSVHLVWTTVMGIHVMAEGLNSPSKIQDYPEEAATLLLTYRIVNIATLAFDAVVACYVSVQLRERLLSAAMADDMKRKSVVQMTLLVALLTASVTLQIIMDVPVFISGLYKSWSSLSFQGFCVVKYFVPGLLLSLVFLYIMRRVEQREPTRMIVVPSRSLVEFVECSSPDCVWCAHHRRYHLNQNKWDVTLMTSFSPRTVDSSYHSGQANHSHGSWSSGSTPELAQRNSQMSRDSHHRLQQAYQAHHQAHQARGSLPFSAQTHGDYEPPREIPGRRGARYS
jgi:hypothetical protein